MMICFAGCRSHGRLITSPKFIMVCFAGCRSHGRGRRPGSTDVVDGGMATMKGRRPCCDGGSTEGITTSKVGSRRRREAGTCVDSRFVGHENNYKS
jgi:hypothetical protein